MQETIELREIIKIILKGKWIIVICTLVAMLLAGVYSIVAKTENFTSTATVQVANVNPAKVAKVETNDVMTNYTMYEFTPKVYLQRFTNNVLDLGNVTAVNEQDTDLIMLTSTAPTAEEAQQQLQQALDETAKNFETSFVTTLKEMNEEYLKESKVLSSEIEALLKSYNNIVRVNKLPGILLLQTVLTDNITLSLTNEQLAPLNNIDGSLQNELLHLKAEIDIKAEEYRTLLANYQSVQSGIESFKVDQYVRTIVEPSEAVGTTTPNLKLNLVIGLVLGLMIGVSTVFFRSYWRATAK